MSLSRWIGMSVIAALLVSACSRHNSTVLPTTVCAVVSSPARFNGHVVRITALIQSDGLHGSWLADRSCDGGIFILWPESARKNPRVEQLRSTLFRSVPPGTLDKDVRATLIGVFWSQADARLPRAIEIVDVQEVSVHPRG
jgi:hypothetical protein